MSYIEPDFQRPAYTCMHCGVVAQMNWDPLYKRASNGFTATGIEIAICVVCKKRSIWQLVAATSGTFGQLAWPKLALGPPPHDDLTPDIAVDYEEARAIAATSPRAAAALLRLCIDKLCRSLLGNDSTGEVNRDIGVLVTRGLPIQVQQAVDVVRVIGNKAVHPGELSNEDIADVVERLFTLVNLIVEDRITRPRELAALYAAIPPKALAGIERRDAPKT